MDRYEARTPGSAYGNGLAPPPPADRPRAAVTAFDRWIVMRALETLGRPPVALVLWNGETLQAGGAPPVGRVQVADRGALVRLLLRPAVEFGELYSDGRVRVDGDLPDTLEAVYRAMLGRSSTPLGRALERLRGLAPANTRSRARRNIHHHYDLGNAFYALWLDRAWMQYTCAYYPDDGMTLEAAQEAKLHHVCRKLRLAPGERVVEAGCGWGGLARFMARHYGVTVRAYNISREQVVWAREQADREGLADRVEYVEDDYRNIRDRCDAFVSVGMLEHVGPQRYRELGRVIDGCLGDNGRGLIHSIGRHAPGPLNAWIRRRIFPGAHPPTLREMADVFEPWDFATLDVENLRLHYARTLEHWLERFERHGDEVRGMFDERFVRAWRLYLAGSIAGFRTGSLHLFQVVFARATNNDVPRSRAALYADPQGGTG